MVWRNCLDIWESAKAIHILYVYIEKTYTSTMQLLLLMSKTFPPN